MTQETYRTLIQPGQTWLLTSAPPCFLPLGSSSSLASGGAQTVITVCLVKGPHHNTRDSLYAVILLWQPSQTLMVPCEWPLIAYYLPQPYAPRMHSPCQ